MKKKLLFIVFLTLTMAAQAKVWRVNNKQGISADFNNFNSAQNASSPNDTLYFEGSTVTYGNIILTKPLVIIGPGYFLNENSQTQAYTVSAKFGTIELKNGSNGTTLTGIEVQDIITISVSHISIIRCLTDNIILNNSSSPIGNILILGSYIKSNLNGISSNGYNEISNLFICNNYIDGQFSSVSLKSQASGVMKNNIIGSLIDVSNFNFANNIFMSYVNNFKGNVYFNNLFNTYYSQLPAGNNNKQNINVNTDVFVGSSVKSKDGQWKLKAGSPAIGAGNDGTDCGMFGGPTPYVLSGLPSIPAIYEITMPAAGSSESGINVTIKARVNP